MIFFLVAKQLKEDHIEQLFYKCYFSNVQMTFSLLIAGQSEWSEQTAQLFCKCYIPNVQMNFFCWLLNKQKVEHMEQLFYKCYFLMYK